MSFSVDTGQLGASADVYQAVASDLGVTAAGVGSLNAAAVGDDALAAHLGKLEWLMAARHELLHEEAVMVSAALRVTKAAYEQAEVENSALAARISAALEESVR